MNNSTMHGNNRLFGHREQAVDEAASTMQRSATSAAEIAKSTFDKAGKLIADHPGASLAAALTCGVIIGWLIKRTG